MRNRYDQLGKGILGSLGEEHRGRGYTPFELPGEVASADFAFFPELAAAPPERCIVDRMLTSPCMIECFSGTPSAGEALSCLGKLIQLHGYLNRQTGAHPELEHYLARLAAAGLDPPRLWLISAGRPEALLDEAEARPFDGWLSGFHTTAKLYRMHIVVVRDVPETRDTLLLRLMGSGATLKRALRELRELPLDAWEVRLARPKILAFRIEVTQNPSEETMTYLDELNALYDRWRQETMALGREEGLRTGLARGREKGREEGREKGREEALRHSLLMAYRTRFGVEPAAVVRALDEASIDALEHWLPIFVTGTQAEIERATQRDN